MGESRGEALHRLNAVIPFTTCPELLATDLFRQMMTKCILPPGSVSKDVAYIQIASLAAMCEYLILRKRPYGQLVDLCIAAFGPDAARPNPDWNAFVNHLASGEFMGILSRKNERQGLNTEALLKAFMGLLVVIRQNGTMTVSELRRRHAGFLAFHFATAYFSGRLLQTAFTIRGGADIDSILGPIADKLIDTHFSVYAARERFTAEVTKRREELKRNLFVQQFKVQGWPMIMPDDIGSWEPVFDSASKKPEDTLASTNQTPTLIGKLFLGIGSGVVGGPYTQADFPSTIGCLAAALTVTRNERAFPIPDPLDHFTHLCALNIGQGTTPVQLLAYIRGEYPKLCDEVLSVNWPTDSEMFDWFSKRYHKRMSETHSSVSPTIPHTYVSRFEEETGKDTGIVTGKDGMWKNACMNPGCPFYGIVCGEPNWRQSDEPQAVLSEPNWRQSDKPQAVLSEPLRQHLGSVLIPGFHRAMAQPETAITMEPGETEAAYAGRLADAIIRDKFVHPLRLRSEQVGSMVQRSMQKTGYTRDEMVDDIANTLFNYRVIGYEDFKTNMLERREGVEM